jgi:hypothetical protein
MDPFNFIQRVVIVCSKHRGSVSSWGRTPKHNKDVGGVEGSIHMLWCGCDVVLDEMNKNLEFEKDCSTLGLVPIYEGDHYHLQPK